MGLKDGAKDWTIKEQIIEDPVSGLTIQFEVMPDSTAEFRLRLFGKCLQFGNRELIFDRQGGLAGSGTHTSGLCKPTWLTPTEE
jgi:hypothetical protein